MPDLLVCGYWLDLAPALAIPTNPLPAGVMSFPVFEAASRRTVENWARGPDSSSSSSGGTAAGELPPELSGYSPDQVKLICLSQVCVCVCVAVHNTPPPCKHVCHTVASTKSHMGLHSSPQHHSFKRQMHALAGQAPSGSKPAVIPYLSLCCVLCGAARCGVQDSDHLWRLSPPARSALQVVLSEPSAALRMTWAVTRTAPLASGKGGPECAADVTVTLAGESRQQLLEVRPGMRTVFRG